MRNMGYLERFPSVWTQESMGSETRYIVGQAFQPDRLRSPAEVCPSFCPELRRRDPAVHLPAFVRLESLTYTPFLPLLFHLVYPLHPR